MFGVSPRLQSCARFLSDREIPALRQTIHALAEAQARRNALNVRELASIILQDPLMTLHVLRHTTQHRGKRKLHDISTVEHALMMLGIEPFLTRFAHVDTLEDKLTSHPQALLGLLRVIRRAQRASRYAWDWAAWRVDLRTEEVAVAALLHDLAEMLIWCFAPEDALQIRALQKANPGMRSAQAQTRILGFTLNQLDILLCQCWGLPELLLTLMSDAHADQPRVQNVKLAVDLARHSAQGWDDPALPDDIRAIAAWMRVDEDTVKLRIGLHDKIA